MGLAFQPTSRLRTLIGGTPDVRAEPPRLTLTAVRPWGSSVDLVLPPGGSAPVTVQLANTGPDAWEAVTYPAAVRSRTNGGAAAARRDDPLDGPAGWLGYPAAALVLHGGETVERTAVASVPADTAPGHYLASLVVESTRPLAPGSAGFTDPVRQVLYVTITVPGALAPDLRIEQAGYRRLGALASARVAVVNSGNVRLNPTGTVVVRDSAGAVVKQGTIQMGDLPAGERTDLCLPLGRPLPPGIYGVEVTVRDAETGAAASDPSLPLIVTA